MIGNLHSVKSKYKLNKKKEKLFSVGFTNTCSHVKTSKTNNNLISVFAGNEMNWPLVEYC